MKIYDIDESPRKVRVLSNREWTDGLTDLDVILNSSCKRVRKLMGDDYVTLHFSTRYPIYFHIGDHILLPSDSIGRFELFRDYSPTRNIQNGGYDYDIRFDAFYKSWANKVFKYRPQNGASEASFVLTDTIQKHGMLVAANLQAIGMNGFTVVVDNTVTTEAKVVSYSSSSILDAIIAISQAFECEYWITSDAVHFGKLGVGTTPVELALGDEVFDMSKTNSDGEYATRIYPFGAITNVPSYYRKNLLFYIASIDSANHYVIPTYKIKPSMVNGTTYGSSDVSISVEEHSDTSEPEKVSEVRDGVSVSWYENPSIEFEISLGRTMIANRYKFTLASLGVSISATPRYTNDLSSKKDAWGNSSFKYGVGATVRLLAGDEEIATKEIISQKGVITASDYLDNVEEIAIRGQHTSLKVVVDDIRVVQYTNNWEETGEWSTINLNVNDIEVTLLEGTLKYKYKNDAKTITTSLGQCVINPLCLDESDDRSSILYFSTMPQSIVAGDSFTISNVINGLIPFGWYSDDSDDDVVSTGLMNMNLRLPIVDETVTEDGVEVTSNYVQLDGIDDSNAVEKIVVFEDIFPKFEIDAYTVTSEDKTGEYSDGSTYTYRQYYLHVPSLAGFDKDTHIIKDETLRATFNEGVLAGMTFELSWEEELSTASKAVFAIVPNSDYTIELPSAENGFYPSANKAFVLTGIDTAFFDSDAIEDAEELLLEKAKEYLFECSKEKSMFDITLMASYAKDNTLLFGQHVSIVNDAFFEEPYESRVTGFEYSLDKPYRNARYTVGDDAKYSRLGSLESKINSISVLGNTYVVGSSANGGKIIPIITLYGKDVETDANVYSALRAKNDFLSSVRECTAHKKVTFLEGLMAIGIDVYGNLYVDKDADVKGNMSVGGGLDVNGNSHFFKGTKSTKSVTFGDYDNSIAGHTKGASIDSNGNGYFANIRANALEVFELIFNRIRANGGRQAFTSASGTVDEVILLDADEKKYKLIMHEEEDRANDKTEFAVGDIFYSYVNSLTNGSESQTGQCWMHVYGVETSGDNNYLLAQMYDDEDSEGNPILPVTTNLEPVKGMVIAHWGNIADTTRQTTFYIDCENGNIMQLMGVDKPGITFSPEDGESNYGAIMGRLPQTLIDYIYEQGGGTLNPYQPYFYGRGAVLQDVINIDYLGQIVRTQRDRGEWSAEIAALNASQGGYTVTKSTYDVVTHNNGLYKCVVDYPNTATTEPGTDSTQWMLILESNTLGGNGMYEVVAFPNSLNVHADRISPQSDVSVYVRKLTIEGVEEIGDSDDLAELGMRIEYCIDDGERQELEIHDGEIEDEDDETIVGDNDAPLLHLEGENIDASDVQDHISIFLVSYWEEEENGETVEKTKDISELAIIVMKDGEPGGQGYSITDMKEVYALIPDEVTNVNSTNVDEVTSEYSLVWSETIPTWQSGYNLWNAMRTVYGEDDSVVFHDFENLGEGVASVTEQYCVMSGLTNPDTYGVSAAWSTTLVQPSSGQSLWNREYRTFVSGGGHEPYTAAKLVTYVGSNGTSFIPLGEAIDSDTTPNNPSAGDYWFDTSASPAVIRQYDGSEWNVVTLNVGDAFKLASNNHLVVWNGTSWADLGSIGGADGNGITDSYEVWQWTDSDEISSINDSNWSNTIGSYTSAKPYLWNATCFEFNSGPNLYTDKECLGMGVQNSVEYYCAKPDGVVPTVPTHSSEDVTHAEMVSCGWSLEKPTLNDSTSRVMWNTELVSYIDGRKTHCTVPSNIYRYAVDGTVISDVTEVYTLADDDIVVNAQNASSLSWVTTIPQWQSEKNLWNAMQITYGDVVKYYDFENLGAGVSNTIEEYAITDGIVSPSSGWSTVKPSVLSKGEALWNREHIIYMDGRTGVTGRPDYTAASMVAYIGKDGTKFIPKGSAYSSSGRYWRVGEFYYDSEESVLSDRIKCCTTEGFFNTAVFETVELQEGDAYKIEETGHLLVWTGTAWADLGSIIGPRGDDGTSIIGSTEVYQWTNSSDLSSVSEASWSLLIPAYNVSTPYLWNATRIAYDDGTYDYVSVECLGDGVSNVEEYYKAGQDSAVSIAVPTKSNADVTHSDMVAAGWSKEKPILSESNPCMWNTELRSFYDSRYASCTPSAIIYRYSKDGQDGQSKYKSTIFKRNIDRPATPVGGTYAQSLTSSMTAAGWSDGVPAASASEPSSVWMSSRLFTSDGVGQDAAWSQPVRVMDTDTLDIQFSSMADYLPIELANGTPFNRDTSFTGGKTVENAEGNSQTVYSYSQAMSVLGWDDAEGASSSSIWMAVNTKVDGEWNGWSYVKVKGETGERGASVASWSDLYMLLPSGKTKEQARELFNIATASDTPIYDATHPDYDLWNAIISTDDDGVQRVYDLENFGAGVKSVTEYYRLTATNTAPSFGASSLSQWGTNLATVTQARITSQHCLWNAEKIEYMAEDRADEYTSPSLIGYYGNDGSSFNVLGKIHDADLYTPAANEPVYTVSGGQIDVFVYDASGHDHSIGAQGDAYIALDEPYENHLFYFNGTDWIDLGSLSGPKGDPGDDGKDAVQVELSESSIFVPTDPVTGNTSSRAIVSFTAKLLKGGTTQAITNRTVTLEGLSSSISPTIMADSNKITISIVIPAGTATNGSARCRVYLANTGLGISAFADMHIVFVQRGKDGEMGQTGPLLYPAGTYDAPTAALGNQGYYNDGASTPYVLDIDGNYYWRTTNPYRKTGGATWQSTDGYGAILDPSVDYALGGNSAWRRITKMESVFTKILFANFANLGRAVFWGTYMFSEFGQKADGTVCSYDEVENINGQHIFTDGKLNGTWLPALYFDLQSGLVRTAKLAEPFLELPLSMVVGQAEEEVMYRAIDMNGAHNLTVVPRSNYNPSQTPAFAPQPALVVLPRATQEVVDGDEIVQQEWAEDGAHCTIVHQFDPQFAIMGFGANSAPTYLTESSVVVVCADERVLMGETYENQAQPDNVLDHDDDAWIIWRGRRTKFAILSVGEQLRLRSCRTKRAGIDYIYWYVENSSDFEEVSAYISVCDGARYDYGEELGAYYPHSASALGEQFPIIGSARLNAITGTRNNASDPADGYKIGYVTYTGTDNGQHAIDVLDHYN